MNTTISRSALAAAAWAVVLLVQASPAQAQQGILDLLDGAAEESSAAGLQVNMDDNPFGEFLDPEIAFVPTVEVVDADTLRARWEIADEYYLYRDKIRFQVLEPQGTAIGEPTFAPGLVKEDEFFGRVEVYYERAEVLIPLRNDGAIGDQLQLEVGYQGCADAGLCYPPIKKTFTVSLADAAPPTPAAGLTTASPAGPSGGAPLQPGELTLSEQDRIAQTMASGALWLTAVSFFGFGLLLAFTPCVLPMVPIISGIIAGQGPDITTRRAFLLSLTFVLAMAGAYTVAGVAAGLTGANLQAVFQAPWILISFSVVFILLALAMFGVYELQIPTAWQTRLAAWSNQQRGGTYIGVGAMGLLSALIVGPCVAAPLAGALIYIGQTGDAVLGGLALFAMSLGMGVPILAIGASAGKLLPKAGPWMNKVKAAFGFLLLGVAIYMLERLIPGWVTMFLWAALLIFAAIYLGALDSLSESASGWRRLGKGSGVFLLVYGVLLMLGGAGGGDDVFRPLRGVGFGTAQQESVEHLEFKQVKGIQGSRSGAEAGKPGRAHRHARFLRGLVHHLQRAGKVHVHRSAGSSRSARHRAAADGRHCQRRAGQGSAETPRNLRTSRRPLFRSGRPGTGRLPPGRIHGCAALLRACQRRAFELTR